MGSNKVVYINPTTGKSDDLYKKKLEMQSFLKINGEGVEVKKGTGPGTAMGILSTQHKLKLMNSVKRQNMDIMEKNMIKSNILNISS